MFNQVQNLKSLAEAKTKIFWELKFKMAHVTDMTAPLSGTVCRP